MMIGLEVHVELATRTKMFCRCSSKFGDPPNTHVCPVCLGLPGALPVPNEEAIRLAVRAALALNCTVHKSSKFDRKNYFYPDLPKGYQISQYDEPLATDGYVLIGDGSKKIRIRRLHVEEDAGKSMYAGDEITTASFALVDFNRCGVPLVEIVSEPDIASPEEAREYLEKLQKTLQFAEVSDVKMEEGSMRVDCNISVRKRGEKPGVPVEIKNLSSFRAVVRALSYEFERQSEALLRGEVIRRETRHWDESEEVTRTMRVKETTEDYRYFPEPDLPRLELDDAFIQEVKSSMPLLPDQLCEKYTSELGLPAYDASVLTSDLHLSRFFDKCVQLGGEPKALSNWILSEMLGQMKARGMSLEEIPISAENLVTMLKLIREGQISGKIGKDVLAKMIETGRDPETIVREEGLLQISDDSSLEKVICEVIEANAHVVEQVKGGKDKAMAFLVGQVMKITKGKANPGKVNELLKARIFGGDSK